MRRPVCRALSLFVVLTLQCSVAVECPSGWTEGSGAKCMKITSPTTHSGCTTACGPGASLACIQSLGDNDLASLVAPSDPAAFIWVGEYQWPIEPKIDFETIYDCMYFNMSCTDPYKGQLNWGRCTNGATTTLTDSLLGPFQPNNFNGGEDCMARAPSGYADNVCTELLPCLCEWPSQTSTEYVAVHGPALVLRATEAHDLMLEKLWRYSGIAFVLVSLPALCFVLLVEGFYVRWRLRTAPATREESQLQSSQRLSLRRRMVQGALALWIGGILIGMAVVPERLIGESSWPAYGWGTEPYGRYVYYKMLLIPGTRGTAEPSAEPSHGMRHDDDRATR